MTAWHEDARFYIFTDCDVFVEDNGTYLYVENEAFNYNGDYTCCLYYQREDWNGTKWYDSGEHIGACNEYIGGLEKAPWNVAQFIISSYLAEWASHESEEDAKIINDAKDSLLNDATEDEKFSYC